MAWGARHPHELGRRGPGVPLGFNANRRLGERTRWVLYIVGVTILGAGSVSRSLPRDRYNDEQIQICLYLDYESSILLSMARCLPHGSLRRLLKPWKCRYWLLMRWWSGCSISRSQRPWREKITRGARGGGKKFAAKKGFPQQYESRFTRARK